MTVKELKELLFNIPPEYQSFEIIIFELHHGNELKLGKWSIKPSNKEIVIEGNNYDSF